MRLFIGIDLPPHVKRSLFNSQLGLMKLGLKGSWKPPGLFHLTLEFLGELPSEAVPILAQIMKKVTIDRKSFMLRIDGLGAFPSFDKPHTLWAGVSGNLKKLNEMWSDMHAELEKNGFTLQQPSYRPHVTLLSHPKALPPGLLSFMPGKTGNFAVSEITLFESKVEKGRCAYPRLYSVGLGKDLV